MGDPECAESWPASAFAFLLALVWPVWPVALDFYMFFRHPFTDPKTNFLRSTFRLRTIAEILLEGLWQTLLQTTFLITSYDTEQKDLCCGKDSFLVENELQIFGVCVSFYKCYDVIHDHYIEAEKVYPDQFQESKWTAFKMVLWEHYEVGLGKRLPYLTLIGVAREVDYTTEGRVNIRHVKDDLPSKLRVTKTLKQLKFNPENELDLAAKRMILMAVEPESPLVDLQFDDLDLIGDTISYYEVLQHESGRVLIADIFRMNRMKHKKTANQKVIPCLCEALKINPAEADDDEKIKTIKKQRDRVIDMFTLDEEDLMDKLFKD